MEIPLRQIGPADHQDRSVIRAQARVVNPPSGDGDGHSDALGVDLCWEDGRLKWWDPKVERYLLTFDEERDARTNAEARADSAEARIRELEAELERRGGG